MIRIIRIIKVAIVTIMNYYLKDQNTDAEPRLDYLVREAVLTKSDMNKFSGTLSASRTIFEV